MFPLAEITIPSLQSVYVAFFVASFVLLFLIGCSGLPSVFHELRRGFLQARALRTRKTLALADPAQLDQAAKAFEGLFLQAPESHSTEESAQTATEPVTVGSLI